MRRLFFAALAAFALVAASSAPGSTPGADARLSNDCHPGATCGAGYVSAFTLATGTTYSDATLDECSISHGRQNEPAVGLDPRNPSVLLGSSNDYCGVYNRTSDGTPLAVGPIWLGYYRSTDGGTSWVSSLVPGYPDDVSPSARSRMRAQRAQAIRSLPGMATDAPSLARRALTTRPEVRRHSETSGSRAT